MCMIWCSDFRIYIGSVLQVYYLLFILDQSQTEVSYHYSGKYSQFIHSHISYFYNQIAIFILLLLDNTDTY